MPEPLDDVTYVALSRRYATLVVAALTLLVLLCVAYFVPMPYSTMRPGPTFDTLGEIEGEPMFTFGKGVKTYPSEGELAFTTVAVSRSETVLSLVGLIRAYLSDDVLVVPRDLVYPDDQTTEDSRAEGQAQLTSSKDTSRVAALRAAGYTVPEKPLVAQVVEGGAADGLLKTDDVILAANGTKLSEPQTLVDVVDTLKPGDTVHLDVLRGTSEKAIDVVTKPGTDDPSKARIGVAVGAKYDFPVKIENHVGDTVGGPSAGTMFALAIYDRLTPGDLGGDLDVAGTGEMAADGTVGEIGGIRQKMAGAAASGADVFLVPAVNCAEALDGHDLGMTLVKITQLSDAIDSLEKLADDPKATVPSCR